MVIVQANNYRNKSNTSLHFNYAGKDIPGIETDGLPGQRNTSLVPVSAYREKYINEKKLDEFYPDRNSRILEEIEVVAKKEEVDDGHFRMYSTPDHSVKVEDIDVSQDVFMFLTGRFPGVHVVGDNITIRGVSSLMGSSEPLFLLDGMPVDKEMVRSMSMFNVDKVEVIKGTGAAIFGMRGGNGVISILTKRGGEYIPDPKEMPGIFIRRIKGFQIYREFYSPDYTADNLHKEIPDYRTTLYWNPYVILNKKAADVSFFSCDNLSRYKVIVEGISSDGRICIGEGIFDVDERQ